ncbi:MAG: methyltransferase domain-containing protein [Alphaproteobacteria bacterium]|nr:methyltransferase domain-containing protein [Alphaproteobacteria bacterium]
MSLKTLLLAAGIIAISISPYTGAQAAELPRTQLLNIAYGFLPARALHIVANLKIADLLKDSPKTADELASKLSVDAQVLNRVMAALVGLNVFTMDAENRFSLTPLSELLLSDEKNSLRAAIAKESDEKRWQATGHLEYALKTGESPFQDLFKMNFYAYLKTDPAANELFNEGMSNFSEIEHENIPSVFDFSKAATIIDIGGGRGELLEKILEKNPSINATLFELPDAIESVKKDNPTPKFSLKAGSFFVDIPLKADFIVLKRVLHNWNDEESIKILENCKNALNPDGKIIIIERLQQIGHHSLGNDLLMLAMGGSARSRTETEFHKLAKRIGMVVNKITVVPNTEMSIIELQL